MAQIVKLRRSSVAGKKPTNAQLELGELSINTHDGKVYFAKSGSLGPSIEELVSTNTVNTGSLYLTGDITASSFIGDGSKLTGLSTTLKISGSAGFHEDFNISSSVITIDGTNGINVTPYMNRIDLTIGTITGSLNVSGSVSASAFVGDGSQLTNLPAAANVLNISGSDGQNTSVDLLNSYLAITGSGLLTASLSNGGLELSVPEIGGISAIYIADAGTIQGTASYFDFLGTGVSATVNNGTASINISGGGGSGLSDGSYVFLDVTVPSTSWQFDHNLGQRYPIFQVYDVDGKVLIPGEIVTVDSNTALINFSSPQTGKVIASLGTGPAGLSQYFDSNTVWTLAHNMGADYPIVNVWDASRNIIFPNKIESLDSNTVRVTFNSPVSGYLNVAKGGHIISGSVGAGNVDFSGTHIVSGSGQISDLGFAITGSNNFKGDQTISGSLTLNNTRLGDRCLTTAVSSTVFNLASFDGATFDYVVKSGLNMRGGTIVSVWDGTNSAYNETSTNDIGNTSGISFDVTGDGKLNANITNRTWTIECFYRALSCGVINNIGTLYLVSDGFDDFSPCSGLYGTENTIYGDSSTFNNVTRFYTNLSLTTPFNGYGLWYGDSNATNNTTVKIDTNGYVVDFNSCGGSTSTPTPTPTHSSAALTPTPTPTTTIAALTPTPTPTSTPTTYSIGQNVLGGVVAYILQSGDPGYDANVQHGLIASTTDITNIGWGCTTTVSGADGTDIGTGNQNTIDIVNACADTGDFAAHASFNLTLNGQSDWYLPSKDELNKLYLNRTAIGGFGTGQYWSSSEFASNAAWNQNFSDGAQYNELKNRSLNARPIRMF